MNWTEKDIECGVMVTKRQEGFGAAGPFYTPQIIGYHDIGEKQVVGLISLTDGMFAQFGDGSKEQLAEVLIRGGYIPCIKAIFKGQGNIDAVENRLSLPAVVVTNSGVCA